MDLAGLNKGGFMSRREEINRAIGSLTDRQILWILGASALERMMFLHGPAIPKSRIAERLFRKIPHIDWYGYMGEQSQSNACSQRACDVGIEYFWRW